MEQCLSNMPYKTIIPNAVESWVFSDDAIVVLSSWSCTTDFCGIFVIFVVAVTETKKENAE